MDKEEAKKELQDLKVAIEELESKFPLKNPANTKTITALSLAIIALSQKSCNDCIYYQDDLDTCRHAEPCEDAISRHAMLDGLEKYHDGADLHIDGLTYAYDLVCKLPSVSTEETGHWSRKTKVDAYDLCGVKTWGIKCQCDRCTFTTTVVEDFGYYKYCPNCGAKMEVEE